jgi:hypothetical protein
MKNPGAKLLGIFFEKEIYYTGGAIPGYNCFAIITKCYNINRCKQRVMDPAFQSTVVLRKLIDTQSKDTIRKWCLEYAENKILPIYEKHCPGYERPRNAIKAAHDYLDGKGYWAGFGGCPYLDPFVRLIFYAAVAVAYDRVGRRYNQNILPPQFCHTHHLLLQTLHGHKQPQQQHKKTILTNGSRYGQLPNPAQQPLPPLELLDWLQVRGRQRGTHLI